MDKREYKLRIEEIEKLKKQKDYRSAADVADGIAALNDKFDMKVLVSLSCTMCPDLVVASQRIAAANENVSAEVYDLNHFPDIKDKYNVMSVPCLVINDGETVTFGKKNARQLLELLTK